MRYQFHPARVQEIRWESPDAYSIFLEKPEPELFTYHPGQYLTLRLSIDGVEHRRAYSMSSSPTLDSFLQITIKRVPGGLVSNYLADHLQVDQTIDVMPPMGNFRVETDISKSRHYILIGAGSGITPLMSILRSTLAEEPSSKVSLWYGNRQEEQIIFAEELQELGKRYGPRLTVVHQLSQASDTWEGYRGRLDMERVYQLILELFMVDEHRKQYFICGPQAMMDAAEAALDKHAVNPPDVHREYYTAPLPSQEELEAAEMAETQAPEEVAEAVYEPQEVKIRLNGIERQLTVESTETILDAAIREGMDPPYACQAGICTACRAYLVQGSVSMEESSGLSEQELEEGYILSCQAHPLEADVILDFDRA
ncbi:MAG: 2Fe-2S iron-sulfur cluster-binding protein [Bacteroidota bacterium]